MTVNPFDPRNKHGVSIPTKGKCSCGSSKSRCYDEGNERVRRCLSCKKVISSVRKIG